MTTQTEIPQNEQEKQNLIEDKKRKKSIIQEAIEDGMMEHTTPPTKAHKHRNTFILVCLVMIVLMILIDEDEVAREFSWVIDYARRNPKKLAMIILTIFILSTTFFIPVGPKYMIITVIYCETYSSFWKGFFISVFITFLGSMISSWISFVLAKYKLQDYIINKIEINKVEKPYLDNFYTLDELFQEGDQTIYLVVLIRFMMHPFAITNYCLGVTSIEFFQFAVGNLAFLNKVLIRCWLWCKFWEFDIGEQSDEKAMEQNIFIACNIIVIITINIIVGIWCKRILERKFADKRRRNELEAEQNGDDQTNTFQLQKKSLRPQLKRNDKDTKDKQMEELA